MFKKSKTETDDTGRTDGPPSESEKTATPPAPEFDFSYGDDDEESDAGAAEETARYIADMVGALAGMAGQAKLDLLTYLLNMARVEAELQGRRSETPEDDRPEE